MKAPHDRLALRLVTNEARESRGEQQDFADLRQALERLNGATALGVFEFGDITAHPRGGHWVTVKFEPPKTSDDYEDFGIALDAAGYRFVL